MPITRRSLLSTAAAIPTSTLASKGRAEGNQTIRIGVLNDQSGSFRDFGGMGSVAAVRQAVKDFGDHGFGVEVILADHQNKPDVGAAIARQWCDTGGVDLLVDLPNSAVALAVNEIVRQKNKVMITSAAGTMELTGPQCSPNTVQWTFDSFMLAKAQGTAMTKAGGDTWFLLYADFTYGQQLARDITRFVTEQGGKMLGGAAYPVVGTTDFSSYLLQAQASGAKVLSFTSGGSDAVNIMKQAREFGLPARMQIAALLMFIHDVHALGLEQAQGIVLSKTACKTFQIPGVNSVQ
jgi:branched-chain amino acid transport system substrate-binding protein